MNTTPPGKNPAPPPSPQPPPAAAADGGDGGGDGGGGDAASGQGDEDEGSLGHPACRAAEKAAGGASKGKAPPAGRKKKWAFCGQLYPLALLPWWRVE